MVKTDLIIQITPKIVTNSITGIEKNEQHHKVENMFNYEKFGKGLDLFNLDRKTTNEEDHNEDK